MRAKIQKLLNGSVVAFVAGVILSAAIDIALGNVAQRYVGILIILVVVFALYTVGTSEKLHKQIEDQVNKLELSAFWIYDPEEAKYAYKRSSDIILSAKQRILVISQYIPEKPYLRLPEGRPGYLQAIEQLIESRLNDPTGPEFIYKRIIQSDVAMEPQRTLRRDLFGQDEQTFEHCKRVCDMLRDRTRRRVNVEFLVSESIPSFPSMMIVDDKYVLFALTTKEYRTATQTPELVFGGALIIEDRIGSNVQGFLNIFERFYQYAIRVFDVEDLKQHG